MQNLWPQWPVGTLVGINKVFKIIVHVFNNYLAQNQKAQMSSNSEMSHKVC